MPFDADTDDIDADGDADDDAWVVAQAVCSTRRATEAAKERKNFGKGRMIEDGVVSRGQAIHAPRVG